MNEALRLDQELPRATDGQIATINQAGARQHAWGRFWRAPERPGLAEYVAEQEGVALEFFSDFQALDRLERLAEQFAASGAEAARAALLRAQAASAAHRFAPAREHLAQASRLGADADIVSRLALGIDQACGTNLDAVLAARRTIAAASGRLEDQVPLGALLTDLGKCDEADAVYRQALLTYPDVSPFALAWVCFQLGVLWGEQAAERQSVRAAGWYRQAIAYLPGYVKARVHLAELCLEDGAAIAARELLIPVLASGDPEVAWRLGDVLTALEEATAASEMIAVARDGFERLLETHFLAFADHGAEFYAGSGNDTDRAYVLARANLANRPTRRAFEQAHAAAAKAKKTLSVCDGNGEDI